MARAIVRPFLVGSADSVSTEKHPWIFLSGEGRKTPDDLRRYVRRVEVVELESSLTVDVDELHRSAELDDSASIEAIFLWECRATRRREVGARLPIARGRDTYTGVFGIQTNQIADNLILERQLILSAPPASPGRFSSTHPASILWREPSPLRVDLEGTGGILPTDLAPFRDEADPEAVWALRSQLAELDLPATASVKLILNEDHPDIRYIVGTERWDDRARAVMSAIHWDVGRNLVDLALNHDEFDMDTEYMDDSIGRSLQILVGAIFGEASPASIRELKIQRPVEYQTTLQAGLRLLRGRRYRRYSTAPGPSEGQAVGNDISVGAAVQGSTSETLTAAELGEPASYKQIKLIVALSGQWLGENAIRGHDTYPQEPLTKDEAHRLIDMINEIPDGATQAKQKRSGIVDGFLAQRMSGP